MAYTYRIRREDDQRTITTLVPGFDAQSMIREAVAAEFEVAEDDLTFTEEYDASGEWTGDELVKIDGHTIARVQFEFANGGI